MLRSLARRVVHARTAELKRRRRSNARTKLCVECGSLKALRCFEPRVRGLAGVDRMCRKCRNMERRALARVAKRQCHLWGI